MATNRNKNMRVVFRNKKCKRIVLNCDKSPELLKRLYDSAQTAVNAVSDIIDGKACNPEAKMSSAKDNVDIVRRILTNFPDFVEDFKRYGNG
ncbi:MAG: hypothetical protein ACK5HT_19870 [Draconibacterium sp.]